MASAPTRERMIESTSRLVMRQGFHATSLTDILRAADAPRGSFYFHFPGGKEELFVAATRAAVDQISTWRRESFEKAHDFAGGLRNWFGIVEEMLRDEDFYMGCPVTALASDAIPSGSNLQEVCREGHRVWHGIYAEHLRKAGFSEAGAKRTATLLLAAEEGSIVMARSQRDLEPLWSTRDQLIDLVERERLTIL